MSIPLPSEVGSVESIASALDATDHTARVAYIRSLNGKEQYRLFELCRGRACSVSDFVRSEREVVIHLGRNGLGVFNIFEKRFALQGPEVVGFNHNEFPGLLKRITGPGHYVAYDSPDVPGEVWIDYRRVSTTQHPEFPPLIDNESGTRALVFGNMVDILRRVSQHVFIGDAFKNIPREGRVPLLARIGSLFATAPFVLCQEPGE